MSHVMSGGPVSVTFPNQFPLGNPENVPGKLEIHFDDLLVESIQRKSCREIQKRQGWTGHRRHLTFGNEPTRNCKHKEIIKGANEEGKEGKQLGKINQ